MLQISNLTYQIGDFSMGPVNITLNRGEYLALFGPSGSGKSLLMELIAGIRLPRSGKIIIDNIDYTATPAQKRPVSMLFQDYALFPHMNVTENILFPLRMNKTDPAVRASKVTELLNFLSVGHLANREIDGLSGGEKQRIALARAIASSPKLLLLDEPLSALDHPLRESASELLKKVKDSGITIIHVTHNKEEVEGLATKTEYFNPNTK